MEQGGLELRRELNLLLKLLLLLVQERDLLLQQGDFLRGRFREIDRSPAPDTAPPPAEQPPEEGAPG